jgi:hypothetical protein
MNLAVPPIHRVRQHPPKLSTRASGPIMPRRGLVSLAIRGSPGHSMQAGLATSTAMKDIKERILQRWTRHRHDAPEALHQ